MKYRLMITVLFLLLSVTPLAFAQGTGNALELGVTNDGVPTLVDPRGMTLYTFEHDEDGESACYDACAMAWPPYTVEGDPTLGAGIPGEIGTVAREDGAMQVTYRGEPLYFYFEDAAPGDANGHGAEDVWYAANPATVMLGGNQGIGNFLVGPGGMTLYIFLEDHENESYCYDECVRAWPPLLAREGETPVAGEGVTGALTTIEREDGAMQVAYNGWPLYFFYHDEAVGDATGNAAKNVWYVATPDVGEAVSTIPVGLELVAEGLTAPIAIVPTNDGTDRMLIADLAGTIRVLGADGVMLEQPFLDLTGQIPELDPGYDERGLLGLALHPDYANNGRIFVFYSIPLRPEAPPDWDHTNVLGEVQVSPDDPNVADLGTLRVLLYMDQPQMNHNAGQIVFGPDGYLYVPLGDGGGGNDIDIGHTPDIGNGQDTSNLHGSIFRLDVNGEQPYAIPPDNPFVGEDSVLDEIYAYGLRNPFRITFDMGGDNALYAGDAGQELYEEVDIITAGGNYGWRIKEGTHCFDPENPEQPPAECADTGAMGEPLIDPVIEYTHRVGVVVVGGYVYRGAAIPELEGWYVFGDYAALPGQPTGVLMASQPGGEGLWPITPLEAHTAPAEGEGEEHEAPGIGAYLLSFGQGADGELYVLTTQNSGPVGDTGKVWKIVPAG